MPGTIYDVRPAVATAGSDAGVAQPAAESAAEPEGWGDAEIQ
jgi:hypothetical protein